eukprot:SAG31_NODE_333_length_17527_cov_6.972056_14_plen_74_part_00
MARPARRGSIPRATGPGGRPLDSDVRTANALGLAAETARREECSVLTWRETSRRRQFCADGTALQHSTPKCQR